MLDECGFGMSIASLQRNRRRITKSGPPNSLRSHEGQLETVETNIAMFNTTLTAPQPGPLRKPVESCSLNLREFRLRWALKNMVRKLHSLSVPEHSNFPDMEEWQKRLADNEE